MISTVLGGKGHGLQQGLALVFNSNNIHGHVHRYNRPAPPSGEALRCTHNIAFRSFGGLRLVEEATYVIASRQTDRIE